MSAPKLVMYHATAKGTGCALKCQAEPAQIVKSSTDGSEEQVGGVVHFWLAPQKTVGMNGKPSTFDFDNEVHIALDWLECARVLQVFRGECEDIDNGRGIWQKRPKGIARLLLTHHVDPVSGYGLEVINAYADGREMRGKIFLTYAEALGLYESLAGVMYRLTFGEV